MTSVEYAHESPSKTSFLLSLPAELRNTIYEYLLPSTLATFADAPNVQPALLRTNHQLRSEYAGVFYSSENLKLDAYYSSTDAWCPLTDARAKRVVLESEGIEYKDLADFWSLASARRSIQHKGGPRGRGILTILTEAGTRRWMWQLGFK